MKQMATLLVMVSLVAAPMAPVAAQSPAPTGNATAAPTSNSTSSQGVLVGSDSLVGSVVRDGDGRDIGKVSRLMIDPADGRVNSVIIAQGGTLGVGAHLISVPWASVKVGQDRGRVVVTTTQTLETAPTRSATTGEPQHRQ